MSSFVRARSCGFASACGAGSFGGFSSWLDGGSALWGVAVEEWGLENVLGFAREELPLADERVFFPEGAAGEAGDGLSACDSEAVARLSEIVIGGFGEGAGIVKFRLEKTEDRAVESAAMATAEAIASQRIARARPPNIRERFLRRVVTGAVDGHGEIEKRKWKIENGETVVAMVCVAPLHPECIEGHLGGDFARGWR